MSSQDALLGGTRRSARCEEHTATWAPRTLYSVEHAALMGLRSTPPHGLRLLVIYPDLFVAFSTRKNAACPSVHLFIVQKTGGKFGTRCVLFSVFENIFSHTLEFSAVAGAKPSHPRPQNIFKMHMSFKYPLLRGTRRSPGCTGSKKHTATWAPRTRYSVEHDALLGLRNTPPHGLHL